MRLRPHVGHNSRGSATSKNLITVNNYTILNSFQPNDLATSRPTKLSITEENYKVNTKNV